MDQRSADCCRHEARHPANRAGNEGSNITKQNFNSSGFHLFTSYRKIGNSEKNFDNKKKNCTANKPYNWLRKQKSTDF